MKPLFRYLALASDFFDLILFDEGHHNVAASWDALREKFPNATIVNFSATPTRADGQLMAGWIIYSYPIFRAIQEGYVNKTSHPIIRSFEPEETWRWCYPDKLFME